MQPIELPICTPRVTRVLRMSLHGGWFGLLAAAFFVSAHAQTITSLSPTSGGPGTSVTIYGSGFGASQNWNYVDFGEAYPASVTSWSDNAITVNVPSGVLGQVYVQVWLNGSSGWTGSNTPLFDVLGATRTTTVFSWPNLPFPGVAAFGPCQLTTAADFDNNCTGAVVGPTIYGSPGSYSFFPPVSFPAPNWTLAIDPTVSVPVNIDFVKTSNPDDLTSSAGNQADIWVAMEWLDSGGNWNLYQQGSPQTPYAEAFGSASSANNCVKSVFGVTICDPQYISLAPQANQVLTTVRYGVLFLLADSGIPATAGNLYGAVTVQGTPLVYPNTAAIAGEVAPQSGDFYWSEPFNLLIEPAALITADVLPTMIVYQPPGDYSNVSYSAQNSYTTNYGTSSQLGTQSGSATQTASSVTYGGGFSVSIGYPGISIPFLGTQVNETQAPRRRIRIPPYRSIPRRTAGP